MTPDVSCDLCGYEDRKGNSREVVFKNPLDNSIQTWRVHSGWCLDLLQAAIERTGRYKTGKMVPILHLAVGQAMCQAHEWTCHLYCRLHDEFIKAAPVVRATRKLEASLSKLRSMLDDDYFVGNDFVLTPYYARVPGPDLPKSYSLPQRLDTLEENLRLVFRVVRLHYPRSSAPFKLAEESAEHLQDANALLEEGKGLRRHPVKRVA